MYSDTAVVTLVWSNFYCTSKPCAYVWSHVMTGSAQHTRPSQLGIKSVYAILSASVRIWDTGSLIWTKPACYAGISLTFWHTSDPLPRVPDTETQLGYYTHLWQHLPPPGFAKHFLSQGEVGFYFGFITTFPVCVRSTSRLPGQKTECTSSPNPLSIDVDR